MAVNTKNASAVADAVKQLLETDQSLGLKRVWGDDPTRVPVWPSAAVLTGPTTTGPPTPNYYVSMNFNVYVLTFFAKVTENEELRRESDIWAEKVRDSIHRQKQLDGLVVHGHVTNLEPGIARRAGAKFRAHRLTIEYLSKVII